MRDSGDFRNIQHFETGIADGFADHEAGVGADRSAEFRERAGLDEAGGDAEARQRMRQQVDGAAIQRGRGDDVVAGIEQCGDRQMQRGHAAGGADGADAAFQCGKPLFQHRRRRVGDPGIDVPGAFEVEQRRGVFGILEDIGRGLVDRDRTRARHRIRLLPGMQAEGLEIRRLGCGHGELVKDAGRLALWAIVTGPWFAAGSYCAFPGRKQCAGGC